MGSKFPFKKKTIIKEMNQEHQHLDNWKSEEVSKKQLELNMRQLSSRMNYPAHWNFFIGFISEKGIKSILDIGCGVGSYAGLLKQNGFETGYTGIDYSEKAISMAKEQWGFGDFICMDYRNLTKEFISDFHMVHLGAFLDVLPNGDEVLEFILSLEPRNVLISRIEFTKDPSYFTTYSAYDTITTYSYKHNRKNLAMTVERYGYEYEFMDNNIFLSRKSKQ